MLYVIAVETEATDDYTDDFFNDVEELTNYINDNVPKGVLFARPLSEIVSC